MLHYNFRGEHRLTIAKNTERKLWVMTLASQTKEAVVLWQSYKPKDLEFLTGVTTATIIVIYKVNVTVVNILILCK
jgi:hypothetical protein